MIKELNEKFERVNADPETPAELLALYANALSKFKDDKGKQEIFKKVEKAVKEVDKMYKDV